MNKNLLDDQAKMIAACVDRIYKMNEWEVKFINSIDQYTSTGGFLTSKQESQLIMLWNRVTNCEG